MNTDAIVSMVNAIRNQAISLVQQSEAVLQLLDDQPPAGPACSSCSSPNLKAISTMGADVIVCMDCGKEQNPNA